MYYIIYILFNLKKNITQKTQYYGFYLENINK